MGLLCVYSDSGELPDSARVNGQKGAWRNAQDLHESLSYVLAETKGMQREPRTHNAAYLFVSAAWFIDALGLPDDWKVVRLGQNHVRNGIDLVIEGSTLPEVREGDMLSEIYATFQRSPQYPYVRIKDWQVMEGMR